MSGYRVKGTTDEVTTCQQCGRDDLKGTVVMALLDADGNEEAVTYMGSDCAATAAGWTAREVRQRVRAAQQERRERIEAEKQARHDAERAVYCAWVLARYGISITQAADLWDHQKVTGMTPFELHKIYSAERQAQAEAG